MPAPKENGHLHDLLRKASIIFIYILTLSPTAAILITMAARRVTAYDGLTLNLSPASPHRVRYKTEMSAAYNASRIKPQYLNHLFLSAAPKPPPRSAGILPHRLFIYYSMYGIDMIVLVVSLERLFIFYFMITVMRYGGALDYRC